MFVVASSARIASVKAQIQDMKSIPPEQQQLNFTGKQFELVIRQPFPVDAVIAAGRFMDDWLDFDDLVAEADELFADAGHAIAWAFAHTN